jgi:hypothetical protein
MKRFPLIFAVLCSINAGAECTLSAEHLVKLEKEVLSARTPSQMADPLACILRMQEEADGFSRYMASSFLKDLMGGDQIAGVIKDARYKKVAKTLSELTLRSKTPLKDSVVAEFARGDWTFYKLFCEEGDTSFCSTFLPDESRVKREAPLLAAASLMRLKKAYHVLSGEEREKVAARIRNLYREIPIEEKLTRRFIDQIYLELFGPVPDRRKS